MTQKRFTFDSILPNVIKIMDGEKCLTGEDIVDCLNALHEENQQLREHFIYLIETALEDKECRKIYAEGLLEIFDDCSNLDEAKNKIKEYLE